jgi:hypothetical protein
MCTTACLGLMDTFQVVVGYFVCHEAVLLIIYCRQPITKGIILLTNRQKRRGQIGIGYIQDQVDLL